MELTRETPRTRWLIMAAVWALLAVMVILHTRGAEDYIGLLDQLGRRGATELKTPLQRTMPTIYADAQAWTRHALALLETDAWRIRHTDIDNAPEGRPVHWNSAFAWLIAGQGWARHKVTGEPLPLAVERSLAWFNLPLLLGLTILFSSWTARRAGAGAGALVALAMVSSEEFYGGFAPGFADHHGLLSVANFGVVLGVLFMGAGWRRDAAPADAQLLPTAPDAARRAAVVSALSGAMGLWISAASVIPAIAIAGIAGLAVTWWQGPALRREGAEFDPGLWRLWGRLGAGASLVFYVLEYAPTFELRMEVNHPLYAFAWWGGGELIACFAAWRLKLPHARRPAWQVVAAGAAILAPLATILVGGAKVFIIRDPLILQLSARVAEGLSLPKAMHLVGSSILWVRVPWVVATLVPAGILLFRRPRADRLALAYTILVCVVFLALGCFQVRFFANSGGPLICVALVALASLAAAWTQRARWLLLLAVAGALSVPIIAREVSTRKIIAAREVAEIDALQPLYRDIAAALRAAQPEGDIVLLTNPDASNAIGYYGRLKTIGTLYWENLAGVKAAAAMHAATSPAEARALMAARGVTHIAVISESSFVQEYFQLARPEASPGEWPGCIAYQLFLKQNVPPWLEEIPYEPPADIRISELRVVLYRTRFGPPAAEEAFRIAAAETRAGRRDAAERAVEQALATGSNVPDFWILKSELLLARGAIDPAFAAAERAVGSAPAAQRAELAGKLGNAFYQKQAQAAAVRLYRASLAGRYDATIAANFAWTLATSRDAALRDGKTALPLAERATAENPKSYHYVSTLAAALAENGRFPEAVAAATRALELVRAGNDPTGIKNAEARLRSYQSGQPWRQ